MKLCDYCLRHKRTPYPCMPGSGECAACYNARMIAVGRPERRQVPSR